MASRHAAMVSLSPRGPATTSGQASRPWCPPAALQTIWELATPVDDSPNPASDLWLLPFYGLAFVGLALLLGGIRASDIEWMARR